MKHGRSAVMPAMLLAASMLFACNEQKTVVSGNDFPDTMMKVQQELVNQGYQVTRIQALDQGLARAGYRIGRYRIIFFGNPLDFDIVQQRYPQLSVFLPLSVTVYEEDDSIHLLGMPFDMIEQTIQDRECLAMVSRWRADIDRAMHMAAQPTP